MFKPFEVTKSHLNITGVGEVIHTATNISILSIFNRKAQETCKTYVLFADPNMLRIENKVKLSSPASSFSVSPDLIIKVSQVKRIAAKRLVCRGKTAIVTDSPYKKELEKLQEVLSEKTKKNEIFIDKKVTIFPIFQILQKILAYFILRQIRTRMC